MTSEDETIELADGVVLVRVAPVQCGAGWYWVAATTWTQAEGNTRGDAIARLQIKLRGLTVADFERSQVAQGCIP
jgi:hypothetical protein